MTFHAERFNPIAASRLLADELVREEEFTQLAENLHVLYRLLRGTDLPGSICPLAPHDHAEQGGPPIPFGLVQLIGQPAAALAKGQDSRISFRRLPGGVTPGLDLQRSSPPDPLVSGTVASTRTLLRLSGDVTSRLAGRDYISLNDGLNRGRYLVKSLHYVPSVNATSLYLWDALATIPAAGVAVKGWRSPGEEALHLRVPRWARTLTLFLPLCATLSLSTNTGERLLSTDAGEPESWTQAARLIGGGQAGNWRRFHPNGRRELVREALQMDCRALADDGVHVFEVELACNTGMLARFPVALGESDCALWTRLPQAAPRPHVFAVFGG